MLAENKAIILLIRPADGKIIDASLGACQFYGYSLPKLTGMSISDINIMSESEIKAEIWRAKRESKNHFNFRHKLASLEVRDVEVYSNPIFLDGESFLYSIIHDVTERTQTEQILRESEKKYRTLFESMSQGAFYQRADGELIDYNQAALEMFGLTADEFKGRRSEDSCWKVIHEDGSDFPSDQHPSMEALRTGNPVCDVIAGVFNPRKDSYVWLNINAIPQFKDGEAKPYQVFVTLHDITKSKLLEEKLRYLSTHDPLTKLNNRNTLVERLTEDVYRASRYNEPLSVFMLDIDHFKVVNDSYGHQAGDSVLRNLAKVLMKSVRKVDYIARYGGEEFVVILPETPLSKAQELAERLRNNIGKHSFLIDGYKQLNITASIGVSSFPEHGQLGGELLNAADSAMYSAKADGRNCVRVAETQVG